MSALPKELYPAPVATMPAGLSHADQQELDAIALNLRVHFTHLHSSMAHIAFYTAKLVRTLQHSPSEAERFFCDATGKSRTTFRVYRRAAKIIEQRFSQNGELPDFVSNIPLAAFKLLDEVTESPVIEAIEQRASQGPVSEGEIKALIESATRELQTRLDEVKDQLAEQVAETQNAQANADDSARQARDAEARANSASAQLRDQEQLNRELLADRDAVSSDLTEARDQIETLSRQANTVTIQEKQVEVVPEPFKDLEEIRRELTAATTQRDALNAEIEQLASAAGLARDSAQNLETLETEVGRISGLFSVALLEKLHNTDDAVSARIHRIAGQLRVLADALSTSGLA